MRVIFLIFLILVAAPQRSLVAARSPVTWPQCRLEQALQVGAELRLLVSAVEQQGSLLLDRGFLVSVEGVPLPCKRALTPREAASRAGCVQYAIPFRAQEQQALHLVLLLAKPIEYRPVAPVIRRAIDGFLRDLPQRTLVSVILFGESLEQTALDPVESVQAPAVEPDDEVNRRLLEALDRARQRLLEPMNNHKALLPPRRVIAVLSDGRDQARPRDIARMGEKLKKDALLVFPIAFSTEGDPFAALSLAELARQTGGTFRRADSEEALSESFRSLAQELSETRILVLRGAEVAKVISSGPAGTLRTVQIDCCVPLSSGEVPSRCGLSSNPGTLVSAGPPITKTAWWPILGVALGLLFGGLWLGWLRRHHRSRRIPQAP